MIIMGKKLKAQMKYANKIGARFTMILGEEELSNNKASLKNMENGEQVEVPLTPEAIEEIIMRSGS